MLSTHGTHPFPSYCVRFSDNSRGPFLSFGVFQDYYGETYLSTTSLSVISWIGTVQGFLLVIVGTLTGPFFDMGHMAMLLRLGTALIVLGFLVAAESEDYFGVFLSFSLLVGVGSGLLFVPSVSIVAQWFTTRRPVATGIAAGGGAFAGVVMPLLFQATIEPLGIRGTFRLFALLSLATLLVSNYTLRPRSPPGQARSFRSLLEIGLFRNWTFSLFSISLFFSFTGLYIPFYYVPSYAKSELGVSTSVAFYVLVIMNIGALIGRTMPGLLVSRFGSLNLLLVAMFGSGIVHLFWIAARSLAGLIVFGIVYGILAGAVVALPMTAFIELWPDVKKAGSRFGLSYSFAGVGILLGSPIAGALQAGSGYVSLQVFGGIFILIGLGCLVAVKMRGNVNDP